MAKRGVKARTALNSRPSKLKGSTGATTNPPAHLRDVARDEYIRLAKILEGVGALDRTDARLIELYAVNYSLARQASDELERDGPTMTMPKGGIAAHPMIGVLNAATIRLRGLISDLGLAPNSYKHAGTSGDESGEGEWGGLLSVTG
jgi:P27 family predicted phage terminase small subunit